MLEAVIFDMDGVLPDSESMHYDVLKEMMKKYGYDYSEEHFLKYCGTSEASMWPKLLTVAGLENLDPAALTKEHKEAYLVELKKKGLPQFSGLENFLQDLKAHGLKLAVASASLPEVIEENLVKLHISQYFDQKISSTVCKKGKPNPDVFLLAASRLGIQPENCIVIEDSTNGIQAAKNAGMPHVGFAGARVKPNLPNVEHIFDDYRGMNAEKLQKYYER